MNLLLQHHGAVFHAKARFWVIHPDNAIVKGLAWSWLGPSTLLHQPPEHLPHHRPVLRPLHPVSPFTTYHYSSRKEPAGGRPPWAAIVSLGYHAGGPCICFDFGHSSHAMPFFSDCERFGRTFIFALIGFKKSFLLWFQLVFQDFGLSTQR